MRIRCFEDTDTLLTELTAATPRLPMEIVAKLNHRLLAALVIAGVWAVSVAAPPPAPVQAEIDALLARLQSSGCEFSRNGSWHGGAEARVHLLRKLKYLQGTSALQDTEQFIELAASSSSTTGEPYQVRCGSNPPMESRQWLTKELAAMRLSGGKGK